MHREWIGRFPRNRFSQAALNECGSALTIFQIKNSTNVILSAIDVAETQIDDQEEDSEDDETVATEASNKALEVTTDFIIKQLKSGMDAYQFEHFVAHLLECMKYFTRVTQGSGDGDVDIIALRDELGFEPPIIKVQCKQVTDKIGDPVINHYSAHWEKDSLAWLFALVATLPRPRQPNATNPNSGSLTGNN